MSQTKGPPIPHWLALLLAVGAGVLEVAVVAFVVPLFGGQVPWGQIAVVTIIGVIAVFLGIEGVSLGMRRRGRRSMKRGVQHITGFFYLAAAALLVGVGLPPLLGQMYLADPAVFRGVTNVLAVVLLLVAAAGVTVTYFSLPNESLGQLAKRLWRRDFRHPTE